MILAKARSACARADREREYGLSPPDHCSLELFVQVVMSALLYGIETEDWDCVAEGWVMLEDMLKHRLRHYDIRRKE